MAIQFLVTNSVFFLFIVLYPPADPDPCGLQLLVSDRFRTWWGFSEGRRAAVSIFYGAIYRLVRYLNATVAGKLAHGLIASGGGQCQVRPGLHFN
ncbi:hypothetical protein BB8028_0004g12500 [Beauveria bassiana]|uniref:Secreted protein n=1 Tax=Beauveria bassiana TaxID=176275 RepID=A0A2S7YDQ3_BEABA|nr:hypothetical protein BB8028_0004g12500 [Beauveria bassiana]